MNDPKYNPDYEYDDYEINRDRELTSMGLPPGQLALIIGVNAVLSLIISVVVVLIANRQAIPGDIATAAVKTTPAATVSGQVAEPAPNASAEANTAPTQAAPVESVAYEVQAGDTLGLIAEKFSVSLFDLMLVNGLTNQDFIQVGQVLEIPLGGLPDTTPTFTPVPFLTETPLPFDPPTPIPDDAELPPEPAATVGPSPTPTSTPLVTPTETSAIITPLPTSTPPAFDELNIVISEVVGAGDLAQETIIVLNQGAGASMLNWKLAGSSLGNFVFPDIFLFSGGSIRIHTAAGQNTPSDLYLSQGEAAWPPGTAIILSDSSGVEVTRFNVPAS